MGKNTDYSKYTYQKRRNDRRKAENRCVDCGKPVGPDRIGKTTCAACAAKRVAKQRAIRETRLANGICPVCGMRRVEPDQSLCSVCKEKRDTKHQALQQARTASLMAKGICIRCGRTPALAGETMCERCYAITQGYEEPEQVRRRMYHDANQKRYRERRAKGICVRCGKPLPDGRAYCVECAREGYEKSKDKHYQTRRYHELKAKGLCTICGKRPAYRAGLCEEHYAQYITRVTPEKQRAAYHERRAKGLCVMCGKPALAGASLCAECRDKENERRRKAYQRQREAAGRPYRVSIAKRVEMGICLHCGIKPAADGSKWCRECLDKDAARKRREYAKAKEEKQ